MSITLIDERGRRRRRLDDVEVAAKRFQPGTCMVRATADGTLWDPQEEPEGLRRRDRERGGLKFRLAKCSDECFEAYVAYLGERSQVHFLTAQRRFINDG